VGHDLKDWQVIEAVAKVENLFRRDIESRSECQQGDIFPRLAVIHLHPTALHSRLVHHIGTRAYRGFQTWIKLRRLFGSAGHGDQRWTHGEECLHGSDSFEGLVRARGNQRLDGCHAF